ncbi:unnamed protein product [Phytophthora lilii]|uniref:Unnamed protein product n=1 Tax=Phytophthora lilii TaxID=2077276 RepID=A0A9W6UE84_9STRA|nr:unnamed protein product [Phytophthora lilii]
MTSVPEDFVTRFHPFDLDQGRLRDNPVGHAGAQRNVDIGEGYKPLEEPLVVAGGLKHSLFTPLKSATSRSILPSVASLSEQICPAKPHHSGKKVAQTRTSISRREQCRINQARYRKRQRTLELNLEQSVQQLRKEVNHLQAVKPRNSRQSPWVIIAEVFRLVEAGFRTNPRVPNDTGTTRFQQTYFSPRMDDLSGVDILLERFSRCSMHCDDPQLKLTRIESTAVGVMTATANLSLTVNELTLHYVFPNLTTEKDDIDRVTLDKQLLGERLNCSCTAIFFLDEETGGVVHAEVRIDIMKALLRVVGNLKDVFTALRT